MNPVRAKLTDNPLGWRWSSFGETIGKTRKSGCIDIGRTLLYFDHENQAKAKRVLCDYVNLKMEDDALWDELRGGLILGSDDFIERIRNLLDDDKTTTEISRQERFSDRPDLSIIFAEGIIKSRQERNERIFVAHYEYGYSLSEIGRQLNLHYSSVSKIIKKEKKS